ncbi:hypothetical protein BH23ACT9_BH23ACT9_22630 [soil metagenome]
MQVRSSRAAARRAQAVGVALVVALVLALLPGVAGAQSPEQDAVAWLTGEYDGGQITSRSGLADLILGLTGTGAAPQVVQAAGADLEAAVAEYLAAGGTDDGQIAKALLALDIAGGDVGDLEQRLRALQQLDGGDAGRFGSASLFTQALGVMALSRTDDGAPDTATAWLADRQCPAGGFPLLPAPAGTCTDDATADVDTTALAIQALIPTAPGAVLDQAVEWLAAQQSSDGGVLENSNSTALAAQSLRAVGLTDAADAGAAFVAALQIPAGQADSGAFRFRADDDGSLLLATSQGVLAFGAPALPLIGTDGPTPAPDVVGAPCEGDEGVTVVVDLTFFDAGVRQGCAPGDRTSGLDALTGAGFDIITQDSDFGPFVCAIENLPELACDQSFEVQFWAYSFGTADGTWEGYQVGASASDPSPGDVEGWRYGEGDGPSIPAPVATGPVRRLAGDDRIATAVAISRSGFADGSATGVVLTRADDFADALAGTPLALAVGGPLLVTSSDSVPEVVITEIQRVMPEGGRVEVLGGEAALDPAVDAQLADAGYQVNRIAGEDRITTAIAVAGQLGDPGTLLITTGFAFPDALAAGTAAAATGDGAVLLTGDGTPHPAVDAYLAERTDAAVFAVGGPAAAAYPDATPVVGGSREDTAIAVARTFITDPVTVGIARRDQFADALAGGAHIAAQGGPLLLTPSDALSPVVADYLCDGDGVDSAFLYGGVLALSDTVRAQVDAAVAGEGCV